MFTEGQEVWCAIYGAGIVRRIRERGVEYPVVVLFNRNDDEIVATYTNDGKYHKGGNVTLYTYPVEIVKAITKPSINWDQVSAEYNYLARDANGDAHLYGEEPPRLTTIWNMVSPYISATAFTSYEPGTCDWEDSLVKRPD